MRTELGRRPLALAAALLLFAGAAGACGVRGGGEQAATGQASGPAAAATIDNLQTAYNGESNASAKYLAFATEAEASGRADIGTLFRAAAKAEEIHARNHAAVLKKMGVEAKADVKAPEVGTTEANLVASIKGESYERDTMYPDFIRQAKEAGNAPAARTMNLARTAEAEHARLYQAALDDIGSGATRPITYYVCPVCGYTASDTAGIKECPACSTKKEKFIVVDASRKVQPA